MFSHNNASPHLSQYDVRQEGEPGAGGEYNVQVRSLELWNMFAVSL